MIKRLAIFVFLILPATLSADSTFVSASIVAQTWTTAGSPYCVTGDVFVASLVIEPGVRVVFLGDYIFQVNGILTAVGTEQDSISFSKADTASGWRGISFANTQPGSELAYCDIRHSVDSGMRIINSAPNVHNCTFARNHGENGGGLSLVLDSEGIDSFELRGCKFIDNTSFLDGGGIHAAIGSRTIILRDCKIIRNISNPDVSSAPSVRSGGGISVNGNAILENCLIRNNECFATCRVNIPGPCFSWSRGGGIFIEGHATMVGCLVDSNKTGASTGFPGAGISSGAGIHVTSGALTLANSIVSYNTAQGAGAVLEESALFVESGTAYVVNSTLAHNNNPALRRKEGDVKIVNSIIYFNAPSQISGDTSAISVSYSNIQDGYPGEGNKDVNPVFESPASLIIVSGSSCIDAGNPNVDFSDACSPPSLGTARNDMGAHGGPCGCAWLGQPCELPIVSVEQVSSDIPREFSLTQTTQTPSTPQPQ